MSAFSCWTSSRKRTHFVVLAVAMILSLALVTEVEARGRGGGGGSRGGGGYRGGGGGGGSVSRGGPARGGSIRNSGSGGSYRSYGGGQRQQGSGGSDGTRQRDGSFENRRGETVDYSGSRTRTEDGISREGSWESTSGASGERNSQIGVSDGRVESVDRSRHVETADGETMDRTIKSERHGDHVDREGEIRSSTGIDAESKGTIIKTDDGFIARGGVVGKDGAAAGTVVRKGDQTRIRGVATDGKNVRWGGANCNGSHCYGGRVTVNRNYYYAHPYYYYPYYYGWYSCPYGATNTWYNRYGTPVYGCSNVVVIHTTISMGSSYTSTTASSAAWPAEANVSSAPVLMYETSPDVSVYGTSYEPAGVYSVKEGERYYWAPGPAKESADAKQLSTTAGEMKEPTANSTVITYAVGDRIVYLTNEAPLPGYFSETADQLYVWIPGVKDPTDEERALIATVIKAQKSGGKAALDREVRKLEKGREAPPALPDEEAS